MKEERLLCGLLYLVLFV